MSPSQPAEPGGASGSFFPNLQIDERFLRDSFFMDNIADFEIEVAIDRDQKRPSPLSPWKRPREGAGAGQQENTAIRQQKDVGKTLVTADYV
jgi:hypothetical protein